MKWQKLSGSRSCSLSCESASFSVWFESRTLECWKLVNVIYDEKDWAFS